jgi:hypothetical protein
MKRSPRDLLRASRPGGAAGTAKTGVIVAVRPDPSLEAVVARLQALGLEVEHTVGDKVIGRLDGALLDRLRADPAVTEVETSTRLRRHRRG